MILDTHGKLETINKYYHNKGGLKDAVDLRRGEGCVAPARNAFNTP
jgi:hypothetical protein